jgi:hypothetical protein
MPQSGPAQSRGPAHFAGERSGRRGCPVLRGTNGTSCGKLVAAVAAPVLGGIEDIHFLRSIRFFALCYIAGMRQALRLHPDSRCSAATRIEVDVVHSQAGSLLLSYFVIGKIADLRMPPVVAAVRTDELWRHTCFEAFVATSANDAYYEFNFSPSTQWAAYRFDGYRSGMQVATEMSAPRIEVQSSPACYTLQAALALDWLSHLQSGARWRLGLSAVIEETSGRKSYWALAHPPGQADFHHSDCFTQELPSA